jgi:hypothetical protein
LALSGVGSRAAFSGRMVFICDLAESYSMFGSLNLRVDSFVNTI